MHIEIEHARTVEDAVYLRIGQGRRAPREEVFHRRRHVRLDAMHVVAVVVHDNAALSPPRGMAGLRPRILRCVCGRVAQGQGGAGCGGGYEVASGYVLVHVARSSLHRMLVVAAAIPQAGLRRARAGLIEDGGVEVCWRTPWGSALMRNWNAARFQLNSIGLTRTQVCPRRKMAIQFPRGFPITSALSPSLPEDMARPLDAGIPNSVALC